MSQLVLPNDVMLVLGPHRSGSSAMTRVFGLLGYGLPKTLIKDNASNRRGHWESQPVIRLNEAFMQSGDIVWSDWVAGHLSKMRAADIRDFEHDLLSVIADEYSGGKPAIIKDPRLCRLMPFYRRALEDKAKLRVVIPVRNPLEAVQSLVRRNGISDVNAALLWLRYMLDAVAFSEGLPRAFVSYEKMLDDPSAVLSAAETALEISYPKPVLTALDDIQAFLSGTLRNQVFSNEDTFQNDLTHGWISDTYDAMRTLAQDAHDQTALKTLSNIRTQFDAAEPILGYLVGRTDRENAALRRSAAAAQAGLELRKQQVTALREAHQSSDAELASLESRCNALMASLDSKTQQLTAQQDLHDALTATHTALHDAHAHLQSEKEAEEAAHAKLVASFEETEREAVTLRGALEDATESAKARDKEQKKAASSLKREISHLRSRTAELEEQVKAHKRSFQEIQNSRMWRLTKPLRAVGNVLRRQSAPSGKKPASHAVTNAPRPSEDSEPRPNSTDIARIETSPYFDPGYYVRTYPVAGDHPDGPAGHYLKIGWRKGYDPSAVFNSRAYEHAHADLPDHDRCPLLRFMDAYPDLLPVKPSGAADRFQTMPKIAVFTAITAGHDTLKEPLGPVDGVEFFVFTDATVPVGSIWQKRAPEYVDADPVRTARFVKTHPHLYFSGFDYAIWMDANLTLLYHPIELLPHPNDSKPLHTWRHPLRICAYEEGRVCMELGKDDVDTIRHDMDRLSDQDFPKNAGLMETSVIVSNMRSDSVASVYNHWWARIEQGSRRDQLSLPAVLHQTGVEIGFLAPNRICMRTDPRFHYVKHITPEPSEIDTERAA